MDIRELSMNDLVYEFKPNDTAVRNIRQITKKKIGYVFSPTHPYMLYVYIQNIHPIPLSDDLLMKNGWSAVDSQCYSGDGLPIIKKNENESFLIEVGGCMASIKFVHHLQHILRLCGLADQTNGFKL